jgi:hypothetical protein
LAGTSRFVDDDAPPIGRIVLQRQANHALRGPWQSTDDGQVFLGHAAGTSVTLDACMPPIAMVTR